MNPNRAAVEEAIDSFLIELASFHDEIPGRSRAEGVSERDWGLRYLRELSADGDKLDGLRAILESQLYRAASLLDDGRSFDGYRRQIRALLAAFDLVVVLCADELAALADPSKGACLTCGKASPRLYCEECARALNLEEYENPLHGAAR